MTNVTPEQRTLLDYMAKGVEYQAQIFNELTKVEYFNLLNDKGYFSPKNNPRPLESEKDKGFFTIPYWPALKYLEKVAHHCVDYQDTDCCESLLGVVREITRPKGDRSKRSDNWRTWQSFVKILTILPSDVLKLEDIDLLADWLDSNFDTSMVILEIGKSLLPKLLKDNKAVIEKAVRVFEIILNSVKVERRHSMLAHSLQQIFKINSMLLGEKCGEDALKILQDKIENIVTKKDDEYCYMWRPAIEDSEQNVVSDEYRHILISGFRDIFLAYTSLYNVSSLIESCFKSDKYIIRRFSIYIFDKAFDKFQYKSLLSNIMLGVGKNIFLERNYHHELYLLIMHHFKKLPTNLQTSLLDMISELSDNWKKESNAEQLDTMLRRRWLYAIRQSGYKISSELEDKYFKDIEYKPEHPEFLSYIGPASWGDESLFSSAELLSKGSTDEIITFLNNFEGKNRFGETAIREAGQSLKEAIKNRQEVFENNLLEFKKLKYEYWYYVVQAFEELARDKKAINWEKVLEFCNEIVLSEILWGGKEKKSDYPLEPKKDWIPAVISDLLRKGLQEDSITFIETQYGFIDKIIRVLLDKQPSTASGDDKDALTDAINTTKGHVLECFNSYALRRYRDFEKLDNKGVKEKEGFWKTIEPLYEREIERIKEGNFEFSSIAGAYLPNLYYLNKDWVLLNINNIFPVEEKHWRCAMQGYSYVNTVYVVIYDLLRRKGHLRRALDAEFTNEQTKRRIIENIAVSYLRGQEAIDGENSLFKYILDKWSQNDIEQIISLFWSHRDAELSSEQKQRIFDFWRYSFNRINGQEENNRDVLSDLNLLAVFFDKIDNEQKSWLMQSVLYVEDRYHSAFFIEYLNGLANKNPKEVGEIFLSMLSKSTPSYEEGNIKSIVEKIYNAGYKNDIANPICDKYARAGFEFLSELYKKNNQNKT